MANKLSVISSCVISHQIVVKNGVTLFKGDAENLQLFLVQVYNHFAINYPKFYKMDNLSKLGWLAAEVLLRDIILTKSEPEAMGIVLLNANASLDTDIKYYDTVQDMASPALFVYTLPNIMIGEISIRNNFKGENAFFIFEEFNADFLQQYVSNMLQGERVAYCICGWVDVMGEDYKAVLYLVGLGDGVDFTGENMQKIFEGEAV